MPIDRKSLKREAKAQLHLAWPGVAGVTLVYLLLAVALSQVLESITSNPIGTFTAMAQAAAVEGDPLAVLMAWMTPEYRCRSNRNGNGTNPVLHWNPLTPLRRKHHWAPKVR